MVIVVVSFGFAGTKSIASVNSLELEEGEVGEEVVLVVGELLLEVVLKQVHVCKAVWLARVILDLSPVSV